MKKLLTCLTVLLLVCFVLPAYATCYTLGNSFLTDGSYMKHMCLAALDREMKNLDYHRYTTLFRDTKSPNLRDCYVYYTPNNETGAFSTSCVGVIYKDGEPHSCYHQIQHLTPSEASNLYNEAFNFYQKHYPSVMYAREGEKYLDEFMLILGDIGVCCKRKCNNEESSFTEIVVYMSNLE